MVEVGKRDIRSQDELDLYELWVLEDPGEEKIDEIWRKDPRCRRAGGSGADVLRKVASTERGRWVT